MRIHRRRVGRAIRRHQQGFPIRSQTVAIAYLAEDENTRPWIRGAFQQAIALIHTLMKVFGQVHQPRKQLLENGRKPR